MNHQEPKLIDFATRCTATTRPESSLEDALHTMKESHVRCLPVVDGRSVIGILKSATTENALKLRRSDSLHVFDLMIPSPNTARPEAGLHEVLDENAENEVGYTVVQSETGKVEGVFTPQDAISAYVKLAHPSAGTKA